MTLKELYLKVSHDKEDGLPSAIELLDTGGEPVVETLYHTEDYTEIEIRVFKTGYVLYREDERYTVFHLNDIIHKPVKYHSVCNTVSLDELRIVSEDVFLRADWQVRVVLEGNARTIHNRNTEDARKLESYDSWGDDNPYLAYYPPFLEDIEREIKCDKIRLILEILEREMSSRAWQVFLLRERDQKKQEDIAKELGVSQSSVSQSLSLARRKIQELRKVLEGIYFGD